jgi:hypothetical protein
MEKLSRYLWSMLLFVYSALTKNLSVDSLCQLFTFALKQATLMRRSIVLNLPPQLVFPGHGITVTPLLALTLD